MIISNKINEHNTLHPKRCFTSFKAKIDLNKLNNNLTDIRTNDFINGIYYNNIFTAEQNIYKKKKVNQYEHDLSLLDRDAKLFASTPNDAPYKLAAIFKNLHINKQNTVIFNKCPELFWGINKNEIVKNLDTLSYMLRDNREIFTKNNNNYITIENKKINIDYVGKGDNSFVLRLFDNNGNDVAMKIYQRPEEISNYSIWGELAIYHDTSEADINNIPQLYIANPLTTKVYDETKFPTEVMYNFDELADFDGYKGGWTIIQYINDEMTPSKTGKTLQSWLKENHLYHLDINSDNIKNGYIIDLGGIEQ